MTPRARGAVGVVGLVVFIVGAAQVLGLARNLINQAQGRCDYLPCVWPSTVPTLAACALVAAAGLGLLAWAGLRQAGRLRGR